MPASSNVRVTRSKNVSPDDPIGSNAFGRPILDDLPPARTIPGIIANYYRIAGMSDVGVKVRCQRCGDQMDLRDPPPGTPWQPNQFWVCQKCGRHYWTTYPTQPGATAAAPAAAAPLAAKPAAE